MVTGSHALNSQLCELFKSCAQVDKFGWQKGGAQWAKLYLGGFRTAASEQVSVLALIMPNT